jgi:hypothetical protein
MTIAFLNRVRGGGASRAFDADVLAWRDAVAANGGSVSLVRLIVVDQFVFSEKASGAWALTDDYWGFWAESEIQALTSLKQRRLAAAANSPIFTIDRSYTGDGATSYVNLGFVPATHGVNCTGTNQRIGAYECTNISNTGRSAGAFDTSTRVLSLLNRNATNMAGHLNHLGVSIALTLADSRGLKVVSRAGGGTAVLSYDRGVRLADAVAAAPGSGAPTSSLFALARNNAGTPDLFRAAALGFVVVGGPLSDAQELAQYNAVQAWATSVGAQV